MGHIQPLALGFTSINTDFQASLDIGQSYIDVIWSGVPSLDRPPSLRASYSTFDVTPQAGLGIGSTVTETVGPTERYASVGPIQTLTFTMPGALATQQDGITNRQSLGIIPGTFRGESGAISVTWSDRAVYPLPAFRADVDGVLRFAPTPTDVPDLPLDYSESVYGNSATFFFPPGMGTIDVRGTISTAGVLTLQFRKWWGVDVAVDFTDELGRDWSGFQYNGFTFVPTIFGTIVNDNDQVSCDLPGVPAPVIVEDVSYLTYTRDVEPNSVTFIAGQTISRELTVDLLTPGSTINIDSPIAVNTDPLEPAFPRSATSYFQTVSAEGLQLPDIDLRATNINVRATVTGPDRLSVGSSQLARERLSIPQDDVNPYLLSPSLPSLYDRELPLAPILPNGGFPDVRTALAIAEVADPDGAAPLGGRVIGLRTLPGFQGFGYDPDSLPDVKIDPPTGTSPVQATARAIVGRDGTISGYQMLNPGDGYIGIPSVTVAAAQPQRPATARVAEINAATGRVVKIDVLDRGYRYHTPPRVVVAPPSRQSFGVQARAQAILGKEGRIDRIEVVDQGSGYSERPEVTIAAPSPLAKAEQLLLDAQVRANIFELYVGDDFGTATPRGLARLSANGSLGSQPTLVQITQIIAPPVGLTPVDQRVILSGIPGPALPPGVNPVGVVISGPGIREGTRVLAFNPGTFEATLPLDSVSGSVRLPITIELAESAQSLYLEATTADVYLQGYVNIDKQSYLINSPPSATHLAPFFLTTRSAVTASQTGLVEGGIVDIILGNDAPTPLSGATVEHVMDLRTRIDSLRVRAASSATDPQGPYPYRITIEEQTSISIDGVAASSLPISISSLAGIELTSGIDTDGDILLNSQSDDGSPTNLRVSAPIRSRFGQVAISADTVEIRNSLVVSSASVVGGRQDIVLEARAGNLVLLGEVSAPNNIVLEQVNRVDEVSRVQVVNASPVAPGETVQEVELVRTDGSDLPPGFDLTGVILSDIPPNAFINGGLGATVIAWDYFTRTATLQLPTAGVPVVFPGTPAFTARLSRVLVAITPGEIDGALSRVIADEVSILAQGKVNLRTDVNRLTATAGTGFRLSELNDINIPLLASGGLVSLEALGVDQGPIGTNPVALSARLFDVTNLTVNVPNGSVRIDANTDLDLLIGDTASLHKLGDRAAPMQAAGDVTIRSQSGEIVLLDAPIAGGSARAVRVATSGPLPATATYLPGNPGVTPSMLSGAGSINALGANFWGTDSGNRPITLAVGDLVLVKDQDAKDTSLATVDPARENGVYRVAAVGGGAFGSQRWRLVRDAASDTASDMPNRTLVRVVEGTFKEQVFSVEYAAIVPTLVERVGTNQLQFAELFPSFDLLKVGSIVNGTGIAPNSYITAIDPVARVVTLDVVKPGLVFESALEAEVDFTDGSTIFLDPAFFDFANLAVGQEVKGPGILRNAVITRIDPLNQAIDVAVTVLGPAVVQLVVSTLTFDPGETDPPFTQFSQLEVGQLVQLFDDEAVLLDTRKILSIDREGRSVELAVGAGGYAITDVMAARIFSPGALPAVFSRPIVTPRATSVVLAANDELAKVRVGQRMQLLESNGTLITKQVVASVNVRVNLDGIVLGDVTIGFGSILTPGELAAAAGGTIAFLSPDEVEFGVAEPGSVPVKWNRWTADNKVLGTIVAGAGTLTATLGPSTKLFGVEAPVDVPWMAVGNKVEFLDPVGLDLDGAEITAIDRITREVTFNALVPAGATQLLIYSRVLTLPDFANFSELLAGLDVYGENLLPAGVVIQADLVDPVARTITITSDPPTGGQEEGNPTGPTSEISFGIGPPARYPASNVLRLDAAFTSYERLFEGQRVYGAGIEEGAVIVSIDAATGTVALTPGSVGGSRGPIGVVQRDSTRSPYYPERFDDWVELGTDLTDPDLDLFNDFSEIKVGQRVQLWGLDPVTEEPILLGVTRVTGLDPRYRTVGLENGALNDGFDDQLVSVSFLPVSNVRFGVIDGVGSGMTELLFDPVGLTPITIKSRAVTTNIGSDFAARTVTFVASTDGRTNDATGSLGKMLGVYQANDTSKTQIDVAVIGVTPMSGGLFRLQLDPLFTAYERLEEIRGEWLTLPVYGTARMFQSTARISAYDAEAQTVTLSADSLSELAEEDVSRVTVVTLPIATTNPDQDQDFRFWSWMTGTVQLQQELPRIRQTVTIDGSLVSGDGGSRISPDGVVPPSRLGPVFIDGQRINRNRSGGLVTSGQQINGLEIVGPEADGTKIARLSIGGFTQGSAIKIEGASDVVVESVNVGRRVDNFRVPSARGITVVGQYEPTTTNLLFAAENNTVRNSTVVGGLSAGIAVEPGALRTYVVGGTAGTTSIDNQTGIFVSGDSVVPVGRLAPTETFIGANAILPAQPLVATGSFRAGSNTISLASSFFGTPLIGLELVFENPRSAPPLPERTVITGIDSVARVAYLNNFATSTQVATFKIGHVAERLTTGGDFNELKLSESVPLDDVYVGQTISGPDLPQTSNVTITAIDRDARTVRISQPFARTGTGLINFVAPGQTAVTGNRRGILLRGVDSRVTNTAVFGNTEAGIEIERAGQQIGSVAAFGELSTSSAGAVALASWPAAVSLTNSSKTVRLPSSFTGKTSDIPVGTRVYGPGIAPYTTVQAVAALASGVVTSITLSSVPALGSTLSSLSTTIGFGVKVGETAVSLPVDGLKRLFVGQDVQAEGLPEFTQIVALRLPGDGTDHVIVSAPLASLSAPNFAALAAGGPVVFAERTAMSNRIYGNGMYGIYVRKDDGTATGSAATRIFANYFDMTDENREVEQNRLGSIVFQDLLPDPQPYPERHKPRTVSRVDLYANKFGLNSTPPRPGGGSWPSLNPLPPGDPHY